jgi:hypothetical protein
MLGRLIPIVDMTGIARVSKQKSVKWQWEASLKQRE